ncbi:dihydrolipoyllysine-residue succinyltransferase component of 2-oxoglutarate dehydrogenase complex, partial [Striga asiatica]
MLGVIRRKAASGAKVVPSLLVSVSVCKKSLSKLKPTVSTPRACAAVPEEILCYTRGVGTARAFSAMAGQTMSPIPKRSVTNLHMVNVYTTLLGLELYLVTQFVDGILKGARKLVHPGEQDLNMQSWSRPFSSNSDGDVVEAVVPFMGESISDGTLATFLKKPGDRVEVDEPIAQVETDKVTIDVNSPEAGVIQKFIASEGDTVEPGTKVAIISRSGEGVTHVAPSDEKPSSKASQPSTSPSEEIKEKPTPKVETTPVVEKPKGTPPSSPPKTPATEPQLPPKDRERRVPMTRLRKRVATRLKDSQNTFALLTTFNEVDMTNLMKLRSDYKDSFFEKHGVKLGLMSGFVKAAISALQKQPIVNAVIDGDDIIYRDYIDISIAGLVVPVLRNAESMNFAEVEKEINTLAKKANDGTISIDEMAGGTFTISNGGVYGSLLSTPIINPPQ